MEDRKLYHLINGEFVHDGMPSVHIPTYEEVKTHIEILRNVGFFDDPVAESVTFAGISNGKRSDAVQASLFDAIHAEMLGEKELRAKKFRKTHDMRKKSKDDTPADRKRNKIRRIRKMYGVCFEDGYAWYWENGKDGQKKSTAIGAEILRNLKVAELEKSAYADMIPDAEHRVGTTNLSQAINRYGKMLADIRKPFEDNGCFCATNYYADSWSCSADKHEYPQKYYDLLFRMQDIQMYADVLMKEKLGQFTGICGPEMHSLWYFAHEAINYLNRKECA